MGAPRRAPKVLKLVSDAYLVNIDQLDHFLVLGTKSSALQDFQRGKKCPIGIKQTPFDLPGPPQNSLKPPLTPSVTLPTTNLIPLVILKLTSTPKSPKSPPKPQKCQKRPKMAKNGQKRAKPQNCKNQNWPILIPCDVYNHFWMPKRAENTGIVTRIGGAQWIWPKKHKNAIFSLGPQQNILNFTYSANIKNV